MKFSKKEHIAIVWFNTLSETEKIEKMEGFSKLVARLHETNDRKELWDSLVALPRKDLDIITAIRKHFGKKSEFYESDFYEVLKFAKAGYWPIGVSNVTVDTPK